MKEGDPERAGEGWEEGRQTSVEGTTYKGPEAAEGCTLETVKKKLRGLEHNVNEHGGNQCWRGDMKPSGIGPEATKHHPA